MARASIQYKSDFSISALLVTWFVLSVMPGIMVWVLGIHVPHWDLFPAPMSRSVYFPGPAYASLVTSLVVGVLATFHLSKSMIISGLNPFWRVSSIGMAIACIAFMATMNPFVSSNYAGQIASQVLVIGDWLVIAGIGTVVSFAFSLLLTIGISRQR